jgi:hypothetical protein
MSGLQRFVFRATQPAVLAGRRLIVPARDLGEAERRIQDARVDGQPVEGWHLDRVER